MGDDLKIALRIVRVITILVVGMIALTIVIAVAVQLYKNSIFY